LTSPEQFTAGVLDYRGVAFPPIDATPHKASLAFGFADVLLNAGLKLGLMLKPLCHARKHGFSLNFCRMSIS
jgi:hypothetical protein